MSDDNSNVVVITELPDGKQTKQDMLDSGWDGPGWYFWDETGAYCHGPFESREVASAAMDVYANNL